MLFSSTVLMTRTLRGLWISVVFVFVLNSDVTANSQIPNDFTERFDGEFDNFLKDMGTMVYKAPKTDIRQNEVKTNHVISTPAPAKYWKKKNTPKAILEDVLMMKLVSYYEDKYKLSHLEPTTTERITLKFDGRTYANAATKNNMYKYNVIDNEEMYNAYHKPTNVMHYGSNRRKQKTEENYKKREFRVPEVVIF